MGAPEENTTKIYGIHMRESANDGSDFANAAADYRIQFLGEDGLLHLKDSAGGVTTPGGAGGGVAQGTSFPGSPSTNDHFCRTDINNWEFFYDGTRWRTCQAFTVTFPPTQTLGGVTGTTNLGRLPIPYGGVYSLYLLSFDWFFVLAVAAHSSTNYYEALINWADAADSDTQIGPTLDSKTATTGNNNYNRRGDINAALSTSARELKLRLNKVASGADMTYSTGMLTYQIVAT